MLLEKVSFMMGKLLRLWRLQVSRPYCKLAKSLVAQSLPNESTYGIIPLTEGKIKHCRIKRDFIPHRQRKMLSGQPFLSIQHHGLSQCYMPGGR